MDEHRIERVATIQANWIQLANLNPFFMPSKDALRAFIDELLKDMVAEAIDLRKERNFREAAVYLHRCLLVYVQYIYPFRLEINEDETRVLEIRIFKATMSVFAGIFHWAIDESRYVAMEASDKYEAKKREAQVILTIAKAGEELIKYRSGKVSKIMLQRHQKNLHHLNGTGQEIMLNMMIQELNKELGPYIEVAETEISQNGNPDPEWIPDHVKNHKKLAETSKSKKPEKKKKSRSRPTRLRTDSSVSDTSDAGSISNHIHQNGGGDYIGNRLNHTGTGSEDLSSASKESSDNMIQNDKLNHVNGSGDFVTPQDAKPKVPQSHSGNNGYGLDDFSEFEHHPRFGQKLHPQPASPYQRRQASPAPKPLHHGSAPQGQRAPTPPPKRLPQSYQLGQQPLQSAPQGQRSSTPPPQRAPLLPQSGKQPRIHVPLPSPTTQQWLRDFDFRLACMQCFTKHPQQEGIFAFSYNQKLYHVCSGDILLCLLKSLANYGQIWGRVRQRTNVKFQGTFRLCNFFFRGLSCQIKSNLCHFAHSQEELNIWNADRGGRFNGKELVSYLRNKKIQQTAASQQNVSKAAHVSGTPQVNLRGINVQNSHGVVQPPSQQPSPGPASPTPGKAPMKSVSEEVKPPPRPPSPRPSSPAPVKTSKSADKNKNETKKASSEKVIEFTTDKSQKVVELIRKLQGNFTFCCGPCFHGAPPRVSIQNQKKLSWCTNDEVQHPWNINSKILVFFSYAEGFCKVRPRPPRRPPRVSLCWHNLRHYGCALGDGCGFAHNPIEVEVWEFEVNNNISREEIVEISEAVHKPPEEPKKKQKKKEPVTPKASTSKPDSHKDVPPFRYTMRVLCGICFPNEECEQSKVNPRMCSSSKLHPWGTKLVYQLFTASKSWVRVFPRHPKLRRGLYPLMCKHGRRCTFREERNRQCMFAHYEEEIYLWHYQDVHNLLTIEEILEAKKKGCKVGIDSQAQQTSSQVTVPTGSKGAGSKLFCMYCEVPFNEKWQLEDHLKSRGHISRINSDKEKNWEHRDPPARVTNGEYQRCYFDSTGMCRYSGKPESENLCEWAHSDEELQEWKERHKYRMMKMEKVREQKLFSFLDTLIQEYNFTNKKEKVMVKSLPGVQVTCNQAYELSFPVNKRTKEGSYLCSWEFKVVLGEKRELKRIGLLYDEFRQHFYLSQPSGENQPQTCPGNMVADDASRRTYSFKVYFSANVLGAFHQWIILDFKSRPVLYIPLQVNIGSEGFEPEISSAAVDFKETWNVHNSVIVKYPPRFPEDPLYQDLKERYPPPKGEEIHLEEGHRLTRINFRDHFHKMLALEELACNNRLKKFSGRTKLETCDGFLEGAYEKAPDGELFAKISLSDSLLDDSEASQIVISNVRYVLLKFDEAAKVVYQAEVCMDKDLDLRRDDSLYVRLGRQCVQEQQLVSNKAVKVLFQFQLERIKFCEMHFGVDQISELFLMFPPANSVPRFPGVSRNEASDMNPRQADASKYILGAGKSLPFVSGPTLIIGPFGTGKTQTMAKTIIKLLDQSPNNKILVCTHSNSAADWLITFYLHPFLEQKKSMDPWYNRKLLRVYATIKSKNTVPEVIQNNYVIYEEGGKRFRKPTRKDVLDCNIVVATLSTSIHLVTLNEAGKTVKGYFEYIFIDEAGQALETETLIPLGLANRSTVVVLAGDHIQMRPKVYSEEARSHNFHSSMLERLFYWDKNYRSMNVCFLTWNYRMRKEILDFISSYHYDTRLVAKIDHFRHPKYYPMSFLTVKGVDQLIGTSYVNMAEVNAIVDKTDELVRQWPHQWGDYDIAVLTPYRLQVDQIRFALRKQGLWNVNVESVQNVQGKQFRAVFISTVRTRNTLNKAQITAIPQSGQAGHNQKYYYGFLSDEGELVTAFTRCQSFLYVVGDPVALCSVGDCHSNWRKYIETCEHNNSLYPEGSSMALIKQEIEAAKQSLNPLASSFIPKTKSNSQPGTLKDTRTADANLGAPIFAKTPNIPSAWNKGPPNLGTVSTTWRQVTTPNTTGHATFERLSSHEYPPLPVPQEEAVEDEFGDYEGELDIDDDILKELKRQVKMDERVMKEDNFWDILEDEENSEDDDSFTLEFSESEAEEDITVSGERVELTREESRKDGIPVAPEPAPLQNHQVEKRKKAKFRMVERDEGVFLVRDNRDRSRLQGADDYETYDSDGEEVHETALQADRTDEWLRLTVEHPDDYKVCVVRFEPSGRVYAIPGDGSSTEEITISSKRRRERALDGDKVVMHILREKEGGYEAIPSADEARQEKKVYGEVKHILERATNPKFKKIVCTVDPVNHDLMCPIDRSSPKMLPMGRKKDANNRDVKLQIYSISLQREKKFLKEKTTVVKPREISERLFVVQYFEWYPGTPYPMGIVTEELPKCDSPANGMRILKLMYGIKDNFPPSLAKEIEESFPSDWEIPKKELITRQDGDFRSKDVFTIDPPDSLDLDDALHVERLEDNMLQVGVHIADVSYFVSKGSNLDSEAEKRATTFYPAFYARPSHMLPSAFSTTLCSLLPGKERLTISVIFKFDGRGNVIGSPQILKSVVCSVQRLTYEQVERFLVNPDIQTNISGAVKNQLLNLHNLTSFLRTKRLGDGHLAHDPDTGEKEVQFTMAHTTVEEMMLLANEAVATFLVETYGMNVPVRHQLPPDPEKAKGWLDMFENDAKIGLRLSGLLPAIKDVIEESDLSSNMKERGRSQDGGSETNSISESDISDFSEEREEQEIEVTGEDIPLIQTTWDKISNILNNSDKKLLDLKNTIGNENGHPKQAVALSQLFRILGKAFYINAGDQPDQCSHFSLQKEFYTHFTSPIRRFIDLVVHRMVVATLDGEQKPYLPQELANICHHCNNQSFKAKKFERMTQCLMSALKLKMAAEPKLGIVEMASHMRVQILYPHERFLQETRSAMSIPVRHFKPLKQPDNGDVPNSIVLHFKNSVYDIRKKVPEVRIPMAPIVTDRFVKCVPRSTWELILNSVKNDDLESLEEILLRVVRDIQNNPLSPRRRPPRVREVTCEVASRTGDEDNLEPKRFIEFERDFSPGQVIEVQLTAGIHRGLLVPKIQLINMTPRFNFCFEHRESAVTCFATVADKPPAKSATVKSYVEAWLPVVEMLIAHNAVSGDDTIFIRDVDVQWYKKLVDNKVIICGCFSLSMEWCQERHIRFYTPRREDIEDKEKTALNAVLSKDYVCVRLDGQNVEPSLQYKMKSLEQKPGCTSDTTNPHSGKMTVVVHGITSSATEEKLQRGQKRVNVEFEVHQMSNEMPQDLFGQRKQQTTRCTIELIPKSQPDRRMEHALLSLRCTKHCSDLVRKICLQKSTKDMDNIQDRDTTTKLLLKKGAAFRVDGGVKGVHYYPPNSSQQKALHYAMSHTFSVIQGPPGTGKTRSGAYLAYFFHKVNQMLPPLPKGRPQILYCGPSNKSVDVIAEYLKEFMRDDFSIVRVYSESIEQQEFPVPGLVSAERKYGSGHEAKMDPGLRKHSLHHLIRLPSARYSSDILALERKFKSPGYKPTRKDVTEYKDLIKSAESAELKKHDVILCTCNASGRLNLKLNVHIIQCIIDEAGMCSEPETLIPLVNHNPSQVVLIGDHMQLRPIIQEPNAKELGMEVSLMEKYKARANTLTIQYRMHEEICRFPSDSFYEGQLQTAPQVMNRNPDTYTQNIWPGGPAYPRVFCHVVGVEETLTVRSEEGNEMSRSNPQEVFHVVRIVETFVNQLGVSSEKLVILSQYRLQCAQIEAELTSKGLHNVKVSTVIKSQGSEWDYVILSTVRSMPKIEVEDKPGKGWKMRHLGFTMDENQMNVALTRARRGLIVVGNKFLLGTLEKWKTMLHRYSETKSLVAAKDFLS